MSVVTSFEDAGPCRKKLTIEVPAPAVEAEIGRVVNGFKREINIPGFRKGKVPVALIRKRFREDIEHEVADRLVPRYWNQAQAEKGLDPLLPPQVDDLKIESGEPMTFTAVVETRPDITIGDIEPFDLVERDTTPSDADVEDALLNLRRQHAEWTAVDRGAAHGDMAIGLMHPLDGAAQDDDEDAAEGEAGEPAPEALQVELGGPGVDEELTLALTGLKAGQGTEYNRSHEHEGETHVHKFRLEVTEVKEQDLPEMDDELAEKFGFDNAEELTKAVQQNLESTRERDLRGEREKALLEQLRERYSVELPEGVVQHESEQMLQDTMQRLSGQGVDLDNVGIDWKKMAGDMKPQAEHRVHERLVLDAIGKHLELRLDESEFEKFLTGAAMQHQMSSQALRQQLSENGRLEPLRTQMLRDQTLSHLLGEGDPNEVKAAAADAEEAPASDDTASDDTASDDTASDATASKDTDASTE